MADEAGWASIETVTPPARAAHQAARNKGPSGAPWRSLGSTDEQRASLIPLNKRYPLAGVVTRAVNIRCASGGDDVPEQHVDDVSDTEMTRGCSELALGIARGQSHTTTGA